MKGVWEMGNTYGYVWFDVYFSSVGMTHKTVMPFYKYFVGMCKRIRTGQVTLQLVEAILLNGQLIPSPEIKIPPMARDGDL